MRKNIPVKVTIEITANDYTTTILGADGRVIDKSKMVMTNNREFRGPDLMELEKQFPMFYKYNFMWNPYNDEMSLELDAMSDGSHPDLHN